MCTQKLDADEIENFKWMIEHDYKATLEIDNLPSIYNEPSDDFSGIHIGFPIGILSY